MRSDSAAGDETSRAFGSRRGAAWLRWLMPVMLIAAALALQTLANRNPQVVERYYSRRIFPPLSRTLSLINNVVGFSIAESLIYVLTAGLLFAIIYQAQATYLRRRRIGAVVKTDLLVILWMAGSVMFLFLLVWGLNYQREPLSSRFVGAGRNASSEQMKAIGEELVKKINLTYAESHNSQTTSTPSRAQVYEFIESSYQQEPLMQEAAGGRYGRAKAVSIPGIMTRLGLSGFYMPFTGEPNFNGAQPDFDIPYTVAHEKAHQRGFAREDEANFLAFVVCIKSADPYVRYSGYLNALNVIGAFFPSDPVYYQSLLARVGEGPRSDLRARAAFWSRSGPARVVAHKINDSYLKANGVGSGAQSYEEDVALIVAYYLANANQESK